MILGSTPYRYERVEGWAKIPEYFILGDVAGVVTDSRDRVFVFCRGNHPVLIFDREGNFVSCWGEGHFPGPHAIFIGPDDKVYLTDYQVHTVEKFTPGGELLMTLGTRNFGMPPLLRMPFCMPAGLALGPSGEMFIADGKFITMWADFVNPHNLYIEQQNGIIYVVESNLRAFSKPSQKSRVTIRDLKGKILSAWEGRESEGKGVLRSATTFAWTPTVTSTSGRLRMSVAS